MGLKEELKTSLVTAMKAKDEIRVSTIRMLNSSIKYKEIDKKVELTDDDVLTILSTAAKQRREAIEQYENGGRQELADKEKAELAVIEGFMPAQMSEDEIKKAVAEAVAESGAEGPKDMGKLMKVLMPRVKGRADGKLVNEIVRAALG
jgi:hypothetical protein